MNDVLALIVSYNGWSHTKKTIEHLRRQTLPLDICVWDNDSDDGSKQLLDQEPGIQLYLSPQNILWTPAINHGIERFWDNQTYLLIMNNDIILPPNGVEEMVKVASKSEVGLTAPWGARLGGPQDFASNCGDAPSNLPEDLKDLTPMRVTYVIGACIMLRKEVYDEVGSFDEEMPLGADDHDYSIRVKAKGYQIYVIRSIYADHVGHASGGSANWKEYGGPSWQKFNEKWDGYYKTEEEAIKCHWNGIYTPGWDK